MKVIIQRVKSGSVSVEGDEIARIQKGYVLLCGIKKGDDEQAIQRMAAKILNMRIMADEDQKMNKSIGDVQGEILAISQFTLYAETKGRRPGFGDAEEPVKAKQLFDKFVQELQRSGLSVQTGQFGSYMAVDIQNDGPTTIVVEE